MTENEKSESAKKGKNIRLASTGILLSTIAIVLIIGASGLGYMELSRVNSVITGTEASLQLQTKQSKADVADLQKALEEVHAQTEKSASLSAKQSQMIAEWEAAQQGNLEKWYVAEAEYLVRLANDHVAYTKNTSMALTLLQSADQILAKLNNTGLMPIRQSIANDIARLQATPSVDVTQIYLTLTALDAQIDKLPMPAGPIQSAEETKASPVQINPNLSWWRKGLLQTWGALKKVVVVRYNGSEALPLVLPKERQYLYDNLHAQLQNAIWGALHGNWRIYQMSLANSNDWVRHYFVLNAPETQALLNQLQGLVNVNVQPSNVDMTATLQLLNNYLVQSPQQVVAK